MDLSQLNHAAVAVAAIVAFSLGGLWYSPMLFARPWMQACGLTEEQTRAAPMARTFGLSILATWIMAYNLAAFIGPKASLGFGLAAGLAAGVGWVAMSLGVIAAFEQRSLKYWLINAGYQVVAYGVMGLILAAWK